MPEDMQGLETWNDALTSLQLLQIDPSGFGGIWLRAPFGPVRERWLRHLLASGLNTVKVPGSVDMERLLGGIDLSLTLQTGSLHMQSGLLQLADQGVVCISMAERFPDALMAPMTQAMDTQSLPPLRMSDGSESSLQERLGLWFDLQALAPSDVPELELSQLYQGNASDQALDIRISAEKLLQARQLLPHIQWSDDQALAVCATALGLGIDSLRAPTLALRVACCHAALNMRSRVSDEDLEFAARRVLAPRATRWPAPAEQQPAPDTSQEAEQEPPDQQAQQDPPPADQSSQDEPPTDSPSAEDLQEMMIASALASLPPNILDSLLTKPGSSQGNSSGRSGQFRSGMQRGRPLPPRPGRPAGHARLHVLATLRAAAPKQKLRSGAGQGRVAIRSEDFHVHRFQQNSASCMILALDASGSAALQRLAEAKGAVELLLQQSYARRDSVCIVAFRGAKAQLLLPMTRSLVRAKRAMTGLPGGGGTPLALALKMACEQSIQLQRQGVTPILVVLSDGRANVTLQGLGGRVQAQADAMLWVQQWRQTGHRSLWIDTSIQPDPQVQNLADAMGASYMPMPQVQAQRMANAMDNLRKQSA